MARQRSTKPKPPTGSTPFVPPYPPSWFDRLTARVDRLPGPAWAFYLVLGIVAGIAATAIQWREGAYPAGTFVPLHVWTFANFAYLLAFMHYLDKSAASAMASFRPLLTPGGTGGSPSPRDGGMFARLSYEVTTWPRRLSQSS
jgi:hypothetical protein